MSLEAPFNKNQDSRHNNNKPSDAIEPQPNDAFYTETRKSFADALLDQSRSFDKYVLTLAAGSFGLSLLFMNNIAPNPVPGSKIYLIISWCFFGASILCTLLSFLFSQHACLKEIETIDRMLFATNEKHDSGNAFSRRTMVTNWVSMAFFVTGVVLLIIFSTQNLLSKGV